MKQGINQTTLKNKRHDNTYRKDWDQQRHVYGKEAPMKKRGQGPPNYKYDFEIRYHLPFPFNFTKKFLGHPLRLFKSKKV